LVGTYINGGSDLRPQGDPRRVKVHDFEDEELGKVVPYGVHDIADDSGWVNVGVTADTAQFAVESIRLGLANFGRARYPQIRELTICADGGGSNGSRVRLWKLKSQKLADEANLAIHVHHYPPGTSKWTRIERTGCSATSRRTGAGDRSKAAWRWSNRSVPPPRKPTSRSTARLDTRTYEKGINVSDAEMAALDIKGDTFHPEWNYTIRPCTPPNV
jgi:hypothetical protein